ncbi:MAG TPA: hypothetical protein ENI64_02930 [Gammaproteobacteria bacterium]|nr:hypothetical protein [Gammaproteobacteria bacterium]
MSRILCVWELGGYLGHLQRFLPLALKLQEQGHEITFVVRDLSGTETVFGKHHFKTYQAPVWLLQAHGLPSPPENYAEILMQFGYLDKNGLLGVVKAWRNIFELIKPDLVLFDYAPTALIAARDLTVPRAIIGSGFFTPPDASPTPGLRPWAKVTDKRLRTSDQNVMNVINEVLEALHLTPITRLCEIFHVEENFITTFQELDFYPNRQNTTYWGPIWGEDSGIAPTWANHPGKKIFAYLKLEYDGVENIIKAMQQMGGNSLIFVSNLPDSIIEKYQSPTLQFSRESYRMSNIIQECDAVLSHAGGGMLSTILLGGIPQLLFPMQIEQYTMALNARELGTALLCDLEPSVEDIAQKLTEILETPSYLKQAKQFADKYKHLLAQQPVDNIARQCELLLAAEQ